MQLNMLPEVLKKLHYWANIKTNEVSGLGKIELINNIATITEVELLDQEVSGTTSDIDSNSMIQFYESVNEPEKWILHWHTHPTFAPNPSHTDITNYRNLSDLIPNLLSVIFTQKLEITGIARATGIIKMQLDVNCFSVTGYDQLIPYFKTSTNLTPYLAMLPQLTDSEKQTLTTDFNSKVLAKASVIVPVQNQHYNYYKQTGVGYTRSRYGLVDSEDGFDNYYDDYDYKSTTQKKTTLSTINITTENQTDSEDFEDWLDSLNEDEYRQYETGILQYPGNKQALFNDSIFM